MLQTLEFYSTLSLLCVAQSLSCAQRIEQATVHRTQVAFVHIASWLLGYVLQIPVRPWRHIASLVLRVWYADPILLGYEGSRAGLRRITPRCWTRKEMNMKAHFRKHHIGRMHVNSKMHSQQVRGNRGGLPAPAHEAPAERAPAYIKEGYGACGGAVFLRCPSNRDSLPPSHQPSNRMSLRHARYIHLSVNGDRPNP